MGTLGEITYDVYIWHVPMLLFMYVFIELLAINVNAQSMLMMIVFTGVMFVVGAMSHYLLDKPKVNLR